MRFHARFHIRFPHTFRLRYEVACAGASTCVSTPARQPCDARHAFPLTRSHARTVHSPGFAEGRPARHRCFPNPRAGAITV
ncbi:hypothetical protein X963_5647 [Burkholderia pseudomallei MSHR7498]|nr:hypothetical protein X963_5647 [Burkholderia pseudomallei MSHR7498]